MAPMFCWFHPRIFTLGLSVCSISAACGDSASGKDGIDLVGAPEKDRKSATVAAPAVLSPSENRFGVDLIQDWVFRKQRDGWSLTTPHAHVNVDKLRAAGLKLVFSAIPQPSGPVTKKRMLRAFDEADALSAETNGQLVPARNFEEAEKIAAGGSIAVMSMMESSDIFVSDPSLLANLKQRGLQMLGLTTTGSNAFAEAATSPREFGGLTAKGKIFVATCRDLGILTDLTYASKRTFWDVQAALAGGVVVSHSAVRALMDHPRNLDDLQILGLKRYGGLFGLIFNPEFLVQGGDASIDDVVLHIMHIKALGALDVLALGTDYDGIRPPRGLEDVAALPRLDDALMRQGVTESEIDGIFGANAVRFLRKAGAALGSTERTTEDILVPAAVECDFVDGPFEGQPAAACNGFVRDAGTVIPPGSRQRFRLRDMAVFPVSMEIFGEPGVLWQVEAQNLAGKILFHRMIQLDDAGVGSLPLPTDRNLTRLFLSPTRVSTLKDAVIWGRPPIE